MAVELFVLFVAPVLLVKVYRGNSLYRLTLFALVVVGAILDALYYHLSALQLGIRADTIVPALALYVPFVIASVVGLLLLSRTLKTRHVPLWKNDPFFLSAALFLSAGQQFLYQGVLLQRLLSEYSLPTAILTTAFLYAFLHVFFRPWFNFILTIPAGILLRTYLFG